MRAEQGKIRDAERERRRGVWPSSFVSFLLSLPKKEETIESGGKTKRHLFG
jgi:hypothetical protein